MRGYCISRTLCFQPRRTEAHAALYYYKELIQGQLGAVGRPIGSMNLLERSCQQRANLVLLTWNSKSTCRGSFHGIKRVLGSMKGRPMAYLQAIAAGVEFRNQSHRRGHPGVKQPAMSKAIFLRELHAVARAEGTGHAIVERTLRKHGLDSAPCRW
jgi:hypothetical protein